MKPEDFKQSVRWFRDYVSGFLNDDSGDNTAIRLKEAHTHRVCANIAYLSHEMNLSAGDILLAKTSALFHDIGRFNQYRRYKTFNDRKSRNHAELGLAELAAFDVLAAWPPAERDLIESAIRYHNAAVLPPDRGDRPILFMRLLRDADKLDIWKVFCDYYRSRRRRPDENLDRTIVLDLPELPECSPAVLAALQEGRFARMEDLRTINDFKLLQISWVYDLNFSPAFKLLRKRRYLEQIAAELPQTSAVISAVGKSMAYSEAAAGRSVAADAGIR